MDSMTTSEVLNRAADLIEERGWAGQGTPRPEGFWHPEAGSSHPVCIEGALNAVLGERQKWECPAWRAVATYLADRPDVVIHAASGLPIVWAWNDRPGRTASEVIEVLRACAVIEQSREREAAEVTS